jgi:hypothetical protein
MKKILSLILAFSFFASEASFMDKVKALPGKAKEFALATKDAAKANKPKAIFTTLQIAVAAHRLHALGSPECDKNLLTEDKNNFFSFGENSPLGRKALEFTETINIPCPFGEETSRVEGELSSLGGKVDNSETKNSEYIDKSSKLKEETSLSPTAGNPGKTKDEDYPAENISSNDKEEPLVPEEEPLSNHNTIKNKNLRPIKYVQDFFNDGIGGTLFILETLKRAYH